MRAGIPDANRGARNDGCGPRIGGDEKLYGLDDPKTASFARQCLLARRFSERGVRFVQVTHPYWDSHEGLTKEHGKLASEVDRPIAGLLRDLKARGLLKDTLVIWGGEFGRTPTRQGTDGRDHHPHAFTMWLAGGGVKAGFSYGVTDDYGFYCVDQKFTSTICTRRSSRCSAWTTSSSLTATRGVTSG